jgi:hypothetical protein
MSGIIHSYYVVAMAPSVGALVGGGVVELWALRARNPRVPWAGAVLAAGLLATAAVAFLLLDRTPAFAPGLAVAIVALTVALAVVVVLPAGSLRRSVQLVAVTLAVSVLLAGPAAYALDTIGTAYAGGDPAAGPRVAAADGRGGPGGFAGGPNGGLAGSTGSLAGGPPGGILAGVGGGGPGGGAVDTALTDYLVAHRGGATWIVAVTSANQAGSIELATGLPVMAMGGFSGSDPAPTLGQLQSLMASGQLRFVIVGGQGGGPGRGSSTISAVDSWVASTCAVVTDVSTSLYDCSGAVTTGA